MLDKCLQRSRPDLHGRRHSAGDLGTIGVCDGIAMNHAGMRYSLVSREVIATR